MKCNFSKRQNISSFEVKFRYYIIPQVTQLKSFGSTVQNNKEIEIEVNHQIRDGWLK